MGITKQLSRKCHDLDYPALSEDVIDRVKYLLLDYIGVAARGAFSDSSRPLYKFILKLESGRQGAVVIGTNFRMTPPYAALANGTAAHSLELDDVVNEASLHPAVAIMPAALATAQMTGCSGKDLIAAIVAGYEVAIKLGVALDPASHYAQGFHPTGTCGTLGAAITAAKILKLKQKALTSALGIAGSQAAGSMEFLANGAYTKRFHAGWAGHCGIVAALLAQENFSGPATIIEGKFGFLHAYSPRSDAGKILRHWGQPYEVMNASIKPHACCRYKQGPIDGILKMMRENKLTASDIEKVTLGLLKAGFPLIAEPKKLKVNPRSVVDAQFSMPFGAAVAVLFGKATLDEYTIETIHSSPVKEMMNRVHCIMDPDLEKEFPKKWPALVNIVTKAGREYTIRIDYPKGDPQNPLTWDELVNKFRNLTSPVYSGSRQDQIINKVRSIDQENDLDSFSLLLLKN